MPDPPDARTGTHRRRGRLGPGRAGRGRRAEQARPQGDRLRARRGARRAAALRRARRQAREVDHRPPRGAARGGGDRLRVRRRRGPRRARPPSCARGTTRWWWRSARACTATSTCPAASCAGVHFAMDYLYQRNRWVARAGGSRGARAAARASAISAAGKRVVVVGGGDTGMDCISNALREGAADVLHARRLPAAARRTAGRRARRGRCRPSARPRPTRSTRAASAASAPRSPSSWARTAACAAVRGAARGGHLLARPARRSRAASSSEPADLVLIAIGFSHPEHEGAVERARRSTSTRAATSRRRSTAPSARRVRLRRRPRGPVAGGHRDRRGPPLRPRRGPYLGRHRRGAPHPGPGACSPTRTATRNSLRHQAETARTVTVGDAFWSGPRDER